MRKGRRRRRKPHCSGSHSGRRAAMVVRGKRSVLFPDKEIPSHARRVGDARLSRRNASRTRLGNVFFAVNHFAPCPAFSSTKCCPSNFPSSQTLDFLGCEDTGDSELGSCSGAYPSGAHRPAVHPSAKCWHERAVRAEGVEEADPESYLLVGLCMYVGCTLLDRRLLHASVRLRPPRPLPPPAPPLP